MASALSPGGYVRQGQRGTSPPRSVNVQVAVRCRPMNDRERVHAERPILVCDEERREVVFNAPPTQRKPLPSMATSASLNGKRTFTYDHVFEPCATQADVYQRLVEPIVEEVLHGYNCTVFAYGQTGTGKTHTMEGRRHDDVLTQEDRRLAENAGIIPRAIKQIFEHLRSLTDEHSVRVSHLELYNEQLTDLLSPEDHDLRVYEDQHKGTFVQGLEDTVVRTEQEIFAILDKSAMKRKTAETNMNKYSSRSHSIFSITIHIKESTPDGADLLKVGKLNLVDLAGSENIGRSGAVKGRAREAGNINQSLLTLGRVITALVDRHPHIPYRDSKLTRLLQESLGGRNKTCVIATVTPASGSFEETASTLDYAYRAKSIKNRPTVNQMIAKHVLLKEYTDEISKLKRELDATREKNGVYLLPEEYESMQKVNLLQSSQIDELETKKEEYEKRVSMLRDKLSMTQEALERDQRILMETQKTVTCLTDELESTKESLAVTSQQRDENGFLVRTHVSTEQQLHSQGLELQNTLSKSLADVDLLHTRVDAKAVLELENMRNLENLKENISDKVSAICRCLNEHHELQNRTTKMARAQVNKAKSDLDADLDLIISEFESVRKSVEQQDEEENECSAKRNKDLQNDVHSRNVAIGEELSSFKSTEATKKEVVSKASQTISELFVKCRAAMAEMVKSVRAHNQNVSDQMNYFSDQQRRSLISLEECVDNFVSRQVGIVNEIIAAGEQDTSAQLDALRSSKATIVEKLTSTLDELINGAVSRSRLKQANDKRLVDLLTNGASDMGESVRAGKLALTDKSSAMAQSCTTAAELLSTDLEAVSLRAENDTYTGSEKAHCVMSEWNALSEAFDVSRSKCDHELKDISKVVSDFREEEDSQRASTFSRQHDTLQGGSSRMRSVKDTTQADHSKSCDDVLESVETIDKQMEAFSSDTVTSLKDGLSVTIDAHRITRDKNADKIPPKREWPVKVDLVRTRHHISLIEERRALAPSHRREVPVEDFAQDVPRTPQRIPSPRRSLKEPLSDAESLDIDSVKRKEVEEDSGTDSCSKEAKVREDDADLLSGSESTTSTRTDDDSSTRTLEGSVLSDVSNRKTRSRSMRRINPVIKKASGIPAPRPRGQRRLPMQ